jgi:hypothetical protein
MSALPPPVATAGRSTHRAWLAVLAVIAVLVIVIAGVGAWRVASQPCHRLTGDEVLDGVMSGKYHAPYPVTGKCAP